MLVRRLAHHVLERARRPRASSSARSTPASRRCCATTRGRSPRTTRSTGASRAATGSIASTRSTSPSSSSAPRARSRSPPRRPSGWSELPKAKMFVGRALRLAARRDRRDRGRARAAAVRGRDDRPHDPRALALAARVPALHGPARGRPRRRCCSSPSPPTTRPRSATSSTSSTRAWERHGHGYHTLRAETAAEQDALTKVRKAGLGLLMASSEGRKRPAAFVEDTAVAPERLGEYVARFQEIFAAHGLQAGFYGHCSVGCLHIRPFLDLSDPRQVETMRDGRRGGRRPGRGVRRRQLLRARRRAHPLAVQPADLRRRALRRDARA